MHTIIVTDDGSLINESTGRAIPPQPGIFHSYDWSTGLWSDQRSDAQRAAQAKQNILDVRRAAYPPLADLADALYWQSQGDESKMTDYLAAIAAVKQQFPKEF